MTFPVYVHVFGIAVAAHQLFELLAYFVGFQVYLQLRRRWPKANPLPFNRSAAIVLAAVAGALFGSKLLAWAESFPLYWAHRHNPRVLVGGKTIVGALLLSWLSVEKTKRWLKIHQYSGDIYVFPVIIGMLIGRVGCFLQGLEDGTYGTVTTLPWGVNFGDGTLRHPNQLYEIGFLVTLGIWFYFRRARGCQQGCLFSQFMGAYLTYRFGAEFLKDRYLLPVLPFSAIQWACLVGITYAFIRRKEECCTVLPHTVVPEAPPTELQPGQSRFLELTSSLCSQCLSKVDAKVLHEQNGIFLRKFCPEHGVEKVLIADDASFWKASRTVDKAPTAPLRRNAELRRGCPWDCGLCPEHEQHCCLAVVEITDYCDQACPICYADSSATAKHRTLDEVRLMLDTVVANEGTVGVVQLSGGEPTLHPNFFEVIDEVRARPIRHLMINTNGRRIAEDREFVTRLAEYRPGIEIYLQFDSLKPNTLKALRGADYTLVRRKAIQVLNELGLSTTLVVTLKKGVNDGEIGDIIEYALSVPSIRGVTFQPIQAAGRLGGYDANAHRLTLTEVRRAILEQHSLFTPTDIVPVPCHTDALAMGYAIRLPNTIVPLSRLIEPQSLLALGGNTICYEQEPDVKKHLETLFSAGIPPKIAESTLAKLCCGTHHVNGYGNELLQIEYSKVFRVVIMQFMDAFSMDLRSVKRSCVQIVTPSGKVFPFDTYNLIHRGAHSASRTQLE